MSRNIGLLAVVLAILLGGYGFRLWHLDTESVWHDEAWSIRAFRGPFTTPDDNTPHVYYLSGHALWRLGGGESAFALRYISVLFGTVTVAAGMRLAGGWLGRRGMLAAGILIAANPLLWEYAQEVRAYVVVPLIALGLLAVADAILARGRGRMVPRRVWLVALFVQVIGVYTHNLSVPLIVWLNAALGLVWLFRRDWHKMLRWSAVEIVLILAYVPWLLTQSPSGTPLNTPPQFSLGLVRDVWASAFFPVQQQLQDVKNRLDGFDALTPLLIIGGILLVLGFVWGMRLLQQGTAAQRRRGWLLASHALMVPVFSTVLMIVASIDFHPRYYITAVPGTLLLVVAITQGIKPQGREWRTALLTLALLIFTAFSVYQIRTRSNYQHDDFRGLAAYYATLPEDAVILIPFDVERALQDYYAETLPIQAQFVNVPLYSDGATATEAINALIEDGNPRHVEFLTWYQLPADVRGMYPCLLTAASESIDAPRDYFGLSTQAYTLTQPLDFQPITGTFDLRGLTYDGGAVASSTQGTCLRTDWTLPQATDEVYQMAASVLNPIGGEIARADALIARADNAPTDDWQSGDRGAAYAVMTLPPGAPERAYTLQMGVYSEVQPNGVDVLDAAGNPAGKTTTFDDAVQAQGDDLPLFDETTLMTGDVGTLQPGDVLDVTLFLVPGEAVDAVQIQLVDEAGNVIEESLVSVMEMGALHWERYLIPADADGTLTLLVDEQSIAAYTVAGIDRVYERPAFNTSVDVAFPTVGVLVGADVPATITAGEAPQVTLIWEATDTPDVSYTAFVQMLSPDGRVIAQSDRVPTAGERPTTGWVPDEYIIDTHTLTFNDPAYTGPVQIVAGLYDAANDFQRVQTAAGTDAAIVADAVPME